MMKGGGRNEEELRQRRRFNLGVGDGVGNDTSDDVAIDGYIVVVWKGMKMRGKEGESGC